MSVEKLPGGTGYKVRWRDSAGKSRRKTVRLWRDAVALDGEMKRKKAMGELIAHEKGTIRLCDFWTIWKQRHGAASVSARTLATYEQLWTKHVASGSLGARRLRELDRESVAGFVAGTTSTLAPSSTRQIIAILQGVLERAVEWGYIPTNPAKGIRKPKLVSRRGRALRDDEVAALLTELPDLRSKTIVRVLVGTGMRPGELRALDYYAIGDTITVERAASSGQITTTKTNSIRSVPQSEDVHRALREWMFSAQPQSDHDLVFPGANGRLWTDQGWRMWQRQVFRPAAQRAGLGDLRPYDLRHTYASQRIAAGDDILTLASQLGHSPTMTLTVYGHLLKGGRDERTRVVSQHDERATWSPGY